MAISPTKILGENTRKQFCATKTFTDREDYRKKFYEVIEKIQLDKKNDTLRYYVLNFYGIGGIGKSSLQKELCKEIDSKNNIIYSKVDFANVGNRSSSNFLLELSKTLEPKKMLFYHFGLAYAIYFQKIHRDMIFSGNTREVISEKLGFVAEILSTIDGLGIIGVIPGIVNKIYNTAYNKLHLDKEIKEDLKKMELMSASQCEQLLPAFFAYDLKKYLQKENDKTIVIFLDTYEALYGQTKNEITKFRQDEFVRELISQLQGVLFVISGRECLDWEITDPDWSNYLEKYRIESLRNKDADTFLKNCGINEMDIRQKMLSISMGYPYHLDILVDTYIEMKNKNITPRIELFANNSREILECFFKYLSTGEIETIKIISIPRFYDFELFNYLLSSFSTGYPVTMFDEFNKFSFVTKMDNQTYCIHEIMRKDLLQIISSNLFIQINKKISEYFFSIFNNSLKCTERKDAIRECIYYLKFYLSHEEYTIFLLSNVKDYFIDLQNKGECTYLCDVLSEIFSYITYFDCVELYEIYTDMIMLNGNFKEAVDNIDSFLKKYTIEQITTQKSILQLYVKKLKHQMVFASLNDTILSIRNVKCFIDNTQFPHQYLELLYTEGTMLLEKGEFDESQKCFNDIINLCEQYNYIDMKCRTLRKKADYLLAINNGYEAKELCSLGLDLANENDLIRYANYLLCTQAEIYRKFKLFEQSKELYINCQKKFVNLGIQPWIAHTELGLAMIDLEQEDYSSTNKHLDIAENIYTKHCHTWGIIHTGLIRLQAEFLQKRFYTQKTYNDLYRKCNKYGYNYVQKSLDKLSHNEYFTTSLMFL